MCHITALKSAGRFDTRINRSVECEVKTAAESCDTFLCPSGGQIEEASLIVGHETKPGLLVFSPFFLLHHCGLLTHL